MPLFQWNSSFSVNLKKIDEQHKKLFDIINQLHDAMSSCRDREILGKIISELIGYTKIHFTTEETYFKIFTYSESQAHISEHMKFIEKITQFKKEFEEGNCFLSIPVMDFLIDWLKTHIMKCDRKYSSFLNLKGLI